MLHPRDSLDLARLGPRLRAGDLQPSEIVAGVLERVAQRGDDKTWIHLLSRDQLMDRAADLERSGPSGLPLYGLPFAIKDNIDLGGHPTTAACPDFTYTPPTSAPVVQSLLDAGAIAIGKTNLDQFAAGLVGTRSPYGTCTNAFDPQYISGGSSSGSAIAVARGLVSFALGTDTAGSGRVPAAFNNLIGLKPTRGLLSARGVVPACRSLDCISIFALTAADAQSVLHIAEGFDSSDPFSRKTGASPVVPGSFAGCRFGVPNDDQLEFFGNTEAEALFRVTVARLERMGGRPVAVDFAPFRETAQLLYEGPWLAERYVAIRDFITTRPEALLPVTFSIIAGGAKPSAADCFAAYYRLKELCRTAGPTWDQIDVLLTPTAGTIYTIAEVTADPIRLNSNLGIYTNFINLMDLSAISVPVGFQKDGLPFGVTLSAPAFADDALCRLGDALHRSLAQPLGATGQPFPPVTRDLAAAAPAGMVRVAVCGAHMSGLPLNRQLTERGARLARACRTAARYRLYALDGFTPARPGLIRHEPGSAIEVEVWEMPVESFGSFVDGIPPPLAIGTVELEDGEELRGFLCEAYAATSARDISQLGGWRAYLATKI
jgi:allophanate hydrolase